MDTSIANRTHTDISRITTTSNSRSGDKYFVEQRSIILQDINNTMDSILNGLNELNISLESSIAVGKDFESVSNLWKTFYNEHESIVDGDGEEDEDEDEEGDDALEQGGSALRSD